MARLASSLLVALALALCGCRQQGAGTSSQPAPIEKPPPAPAVDRSCTTAADCEAVACECTCSGGGGVSLREDAVLRKDAERWYQERGCARPTRCPEAACPPSRLDCVGGACHVVYGGN